MPKDGKIKLNISVKDTGTVPGNLTFAIQTEYSEDSIKIKEITGITSAQGITDMEIELSEGTYYFYYKMNNDTGDLSDTSLYVNCEVNILPTASVNISKLSTYDITTFEDITKDGYDKIQFGETDMDLVLPFSADQAGGLIISMAENTRNYDYLDALLYEDQECTKPIGKSFTLEAGDEPINILRYISKKGTYYIKFTLSSSDLVGITAFKVKLYTISSETRTLVSGKGTIAYQDSNSNKITYKVIVKNSGLLQLLVTPYDNSKGGMASFQLLDGNKKKLTKNNEVISNWNSEGAYDPVLKYYNVTKGTYYIQIDTSCGVYKFEYFFDKDVSEAGTKKSNAKLLKLGGKIAQGYFTISDKTTKVDWYKFTIPSSQYVKVILAYQSDGEIEYDIIDSKGKIIWDRNNEKERPQGSYYNWVEHNYSKGTYYIKVYKGSNTSSFSYGVILTK